jgi:hypothetical protein
MAGLFDDILGNLDKDRGASGKGFEFGTHDVIIMLAEAQTDAKNRDLIRITVCDKADENKVGEATFWFHTKGATQMSVDKVLRLLIHNVDEDKKPKVKELGEQLFAKIDDFGKARDAALKLLNEKLIGKEGYLAVNPSGKYTTSKYGDLWYYPAAPQGAAKDIKNDATTPADLDIPDDWA